MQIPNRTLLISFFIFFLIFFSKGWALDSKKVHPRNVKLVRQGLMKKIPTYHPEIPRITAYEALSLYRKGKALFLHTSHSNKHIIVGAIHMTGAKAAKINPNKLPFKKGQVLVTYCP